MHTRIARWARVGGLAALVSASVALGVAEPVHSASPYAAPAAPAQAAAPDIFVARQAKDAARDLGTDGDMAAVGIIAHEMGHAVAMQLGADSPVPYYNEAAADCLAGVFTQRSAENGSLEPGDLDEAFHGLAAAGDPTPQFTGIRRIDARISYRAALMGHGTREQRLANFRTGYEHGAGACVPELGES